MAVVQVQFELLFARFLDPLLLDGLLFLDGLPFREFFPSLLFVDFGVGGHGRALSRLLSTWRKLEASLVCARTSLLSTDIDLSAVLTTPTDSLSVRWCSQLESFASGLKFASPRLLIDKFHRRGLIFFEFFERRSCASRLDRTNKALDVVCTKSYTCPLPERIVVHVPWTAEYRQHHQSVWQLLSF